MINCNLEYVFNVRNATEAREMVENVELPKEYVCDSFEIVKISDEKGKEYNV